MRSWPRTSRRSLLAGALGAGAVALTGLVPGCTAEPAPPPPDPLQPLLDAARADAALAEAVAGVHGGLAVASRALAADRRAHADSLQAEIRRATPSPVPSSTASGTASSATESGAPSAAPGPVVPAEPHAAATALVAAARAASRQAGQLVTAVPRYRAGLVASISACCASHVAVLA